MTIVKLPELTLTPSAERRSKTWIKHLTSVDTTVGTGFAFIGAFAGFGATVEVPDGAWFLSYVEDVRSSGRVDGRDVTLYQLRAGELVTVEKWELDAKAGWALKVRDTIAAHLTAAAKPDTETLLAARKDLLDRLAEIDAQLADTSGAPLHLHLQSGAE